VVQPVEALSSTENLLKVPLCGTFNKFSGFYNSAKRCNETLPKNHGQIANQYHDQDNLPQDNE